MRLFPPSEDGTFGYLMLFSDGNRIDLTLATLDMAERCVRGDKLTVVLMDKDHRLPPIQPPTDEDYWVKPPSAEFFADCCNEFWWVSTYVAKGLWRKEFLYARKHLDENVRPMLLMMVAWYVGIHTDFSVSVGKCYKYLERYLTVEEWEALLATYPNGDYESNWNALAAICELFRKIARLVGAHFGYEYPEQDDQRVSAYLKHVRELPPDVKEIY